MTVKIGAEILLECLLHEKVKYIFGVPGGQWVPFLDAICRLGRDRGLDFVTTRHEQAAANMADAWTRVTGWPGVCLGTVGPGAANLVPGVYPAWADSIPMIVLTAQNQTWRSYPDHGSMQALDQLPLLAPITKWNAVVNHPSRIPELVQRAFRVALAGKPGPVHLDIPVDVIFGSCETDDLHIVGPRHYRAYRQPCGDPDLIELAAQYLASAERPLIHVGGGVLRDDAADKVLVLAEYLGAPVTTSVGARGAIPEDHPLCLIPSSYGALGAQAEADVVLFVGGRLGDLDFWGRPPAWGEVGDQIWIQVDISGEQIALNRPVDVAIVGGAQVVLKDLLVAVRKRTRRRESGEFLADARAAQDAWLQPHLDAGESDQVPIHPLRLVKEVRDFFPREAISCVDGGNIAVWALYLNRIYEPRTFLWPGDSGHLGTGLPYAIGARLAAPHKQVYLITGDGAFMTAIQELETARRLNTPLVAAIANDNAWGMIKGSQLASCEQRCIGVDFADVRYDEVARACGCYGERVEDPAQIRPALARAVDSGLPAVLDVMVDPEIHVAPPDLDTLGGIWLEGCELPD